MYAFRVAQQERLSRWAGGTEDRGNFLEPAWHSVLV
jgi:hypothetical protein